MKSIIYFVILLTYFRSREVDTKRILGVFPLDFPSHNIFFEAIMKRLAKEGYEIDIISHYELSNPPQNYKTIINLAKLDFPYPVTKFHTIQHAIESIKDAVGHLTEVYGVYMCPLMGHKKMQEFIQNPPKYDLIIVQGYSISCFFGLGRIFNVPVITATPTLEFPWISRQIGNPFSTAFFSTLFMMQAEINTFWERLHNTVQTHIALLRFDSYTERPHTEAMRKFLSPDMPNIREIERNVALSLVNSHRTLQGIRPTTPNLIEVAGLHIDEDHSNFTRELQKWMDESKDGVVYIAFGTLVPIESLSNDTILAMKNSFSKIAPTRVLIKANKSKFLIEMPKNVKSMNWIPQIPVLRHNNTRAFMTHGGVHSIQEALHFGIPVIGVPLFFDQRKNVDILVCKKMGVQLNHDEITEKSLDEALRKILKNPKYREAAKYHSRLFRDRPMRPMDTAIYWIEYVIRNGGKPFRSPAADLYWWQNELLDVYAFLLFCIILVFATISIVLKIAVKLIFIKNLKNQLKRD